MAKISEEKKRWNELSPIEIKLVIKSGKCKHELGDKFYYEHPYKKPDICNALLHVLDLYTWRVALDFPSWETDDTGIFRIHCPAHKGTVWEMRKKTE
ncbi:MAG: hypothetical protein GY870_04285 [archaeon]|nr:hypothetical protein [archaeon]